MAITRFSRDTLRPGVILGDFGDGRGGAQAAKGQVEQGHDSHRLVSEKYAQLQGPALAGAGCRYAATTISCFLCQEARQDLRGAPKASTRPDIQKVIHRIVTGVGTTR
jgi:hypothetical protein